MKTLIKRLFGITALEEEIKRLDSERIDAELMVKYLRSQLDERYETEWKITKDGKRRYRKIATKVLVNSWRTQSESIEDMEMVILPPPMPLHGQLYGSNSVISMIDPTELERVMQCNQASEVW
jgi:hypothetical protein